MPVEGIAAPCGHFGLDQDAVPVAAVQHAPVLLPVHARVDAVQFLQVVMIVRDPACGSAMPNSGLLPAMRSTPIRRTRSPFK